MTVDIKLDSNALQALFPEGTEARVRLQSAVIQNYAQANLKGCTKQVKEEVMSEMRRMLGTKELHNAVVEQVREEISVYWKPAAGFGPVYQLTKEGRERIASCVSDQISAIIHENVRAKLNEATKTAEEIISRYASTLTSERMEEMFERKLETRMNEFIKQMLDKRS